MSELRLGQSKAYLQGKAQREGLVAFLPLPNEIFLDIDVKLGRETERVLEYIQQMTIDPLADWAGEDTDRAFMVLSRLQTVSNGGNTHIYLRFSKTMTDIERVIFQVCLGSDPIKEFFSFLQLKQVRGFEKVQCECPVALFETVLGARQVEQWRANANTK